MKNCNRVFRLGNYIKIEKFDFFIIQSFKTFWYPRFFSHSSKFVRFEFTINWLKHNFIFQIDA